MYNLSISDDQFICLAFMSLISAAEKALFDSEGSWLTGKSFPSHLAQTYGEGCGLRREFL